jgi:hypothetical protein
VTFILIALLWTLVAVHVMGGAVLFHRLFPRESTWFGFVVPSLVLVVLLNFIEHGLALPGLHWFLPFTFMGSVWMIVSPKTRWRFLRLPTAIFLASFAFTLLLKCLHPDIANVQDGVVDLHLVSDFCMGQTLPPQSTWAPGLKSEAYYSLPPYAASVLIRLLNLDMGAGFNLSSALLSAFSYFMAGAIAWRVGRHKAWIVAVSLGLMASAMGGEAPFLWLAHSASIDPSGAATLRWQDGVPGLPGAVGDGVMVPPGGYSWLGAYDSVMAGRFLVLFSVYCLVEMVRRRQTNLPWAGSLGACLLMLVSSSWGAPLLVAIFVGGMTWCLWRRTAPRDWRVVVMLLGGLLLALAPVLSSVLLAPSTPGENASGPAPFFEFVVQWWPLYLPWGVLLFCRRLTPSVRILQIGLPLAFLAIEFSGVANHLDMTGRLWGYMFIAGCAVFIPAMAAARAYSARGLLLVFLVAGGLSFCFRVDFEHRTLADDRWRLDGRGDLRADSVKGRLYNFVSTLDHKILITGESHWANDEHPMLANLTHNSDYAACGYDSTLASERASFGEVTQREGLDNALYAGKYPSPLNYLNEHDIAAVVIWPDDHIPNEVLARLKDQLAPTYFYQDCRDTNCASDAPNAGVFMRGPDDASPASLPDLASYP